MGALGIGFIYWGLLALLKVQFSKDNDSMRFMGLYHEGHEEHEEKTKKQTSCASCPSWCKYDTVTRFGDL